MYLFWAWPELMVLLQFRSKLGVLLGQSINEVVVSLSLMHCAFFCRMVICLWAADSYPFGFIGLWAHPLGSLVYGPTLCHWSMGPPCGLTGLWAHPAGSLVCGLSCGAICVHCTAQTTVA